MKSNFSYIYTIISIGNIILDSIAMKVRRAWFTAFAKVALSATPRKSHHDSSVETIFSLPAVASWFENLAYRSSTNTILATRLDIPQIWALDPTTREGTVLANVTETLGLVGITQLTSTVPETFVVASTNFSATTGVQANSSVLWTLTFGNDGSATVEKAVAIPQMGLINGITQWDDHSVLVADSTMGVIRIADLTTGEAAVVLEDPTMAPTEATGVNGVHVYRPNGSGETYVYYTSMDQGLLARVPVSRITAARHPSNASVEIIASGFKSPDDFALLPDGTVLLATGKSNTIVHVALDGKVEIVAGSSGSLVLASSTACVLGRGGELYVTTAGGKEAPVNGTLTGPGSIVEIDLWESVEVTRQV